MVQRRRLSGFIEPCLPSKVARPSSGPLWVHEIKHDGYRLMARRDGPRIRCFTRNSHVIDKIQAFCFGCCLMIGGEFCEPTRSSRKVVAGHSLPLRISTT
jgi:hypothetical protein